MTGILLIQLGTPDAPTKKALRPYLKQFLSDPRVIELPRLLWQPLLRGVILNTRPKASAAKYARVWDAETGSPLLHYTKRQAALLQERFPATPVRFGMQVGNPRLDDVIRGMVKEGFDRVIAIPMYPQYSATTYASATDILFSTLTTVRRVPAVRVVPPHYDHPAYIKAVAQVVRDDLARLSWEPEHFVVSFHGLPQKYAQRGDPYATHCVRTTELLVKELGWPRDRWTRTFQSRFGPQAWLKPYTDDVLAALAKRGVKKVMCILPGFTSDCLETIDEIGHESEEVFHAAGGEHLRACPCLNDHPAWIDALETILREEGVNWLPVKAEAAGEPALAR
jgi:ferrochelatase